MKKLIDWAMSFLLLVAATGQNRLASLNALPDIQLLEPGDFNGDEVKARTGERWLGLFPTARGFVFKETTLVVDTVFDVVVDEENSATRSGKRVSVKSRMHPLLLLRGATELAQGSVETVFQSEKSLGNGTSLNLQLAGTKYQLKVLSDDPQSRDYLVQNTKLILTSKRAQTANPLLTEAAERCGMGPSLGG